MMKTNGKIILAAAALTGFAPAFAQTPEEVAQKAMDGYALFVRDSLCDDRIKGYGMMLEAAWEGDAKAANNIGWLKLHGDFTEKDEQGALTWFSRAADQGLPVGALNYMDLILHRPDLTAAKAPDPKVLARTSSLAANAMLMGRGLPYDYRRGQEYLIRAAIFGDDRARVTLGQQLEMYPDAISAEEMSRLLDQCDPLLPPDLRHLQEGTDKSSLIEEMLTPQYWYDHSCTPTFLP